MILSSAPFNGAVEFRKLPDGAVSAPSLAFENEPTTGLYRPGAGQLGISVLGTQVSVFRAGGLDIVGGTQTTDVKALSITQTWNNAGVTFTGVSVSITSTAAAAGSMVQNWLVGGNSVLSIQSNGLLTFGTSKDAGFLRSAAGVMVIMGAAGDTTGYGVIGSHTANSAGMIIGYAGGQVSGLSLGDSAKIVWMNGSPAAGTIDTGLYRNAAGVVEVNNGTVGTYRDLLLRQLRTDYTNTAGGTTGNQTINKSAGSVNFAGGATSLTVTNSLCSANSHVFATIATNDATATIKNVVPGSGSFVITLTAAATAETKVNFVVIDP